MIAASKRVRPKVELRRQQILDAACDCVRRSGFHSTSMAEIAKAAGLSVGQIYRYFENKEAIISAIVERDYANMRQKFAELKNANETRAEALISQCPLVLERGYDSDRAALFLEVMAEAARNPNVANILRHADAAGLSLMCDLLEESRPAGLTDAQLAARAEVMFMLFEGMVTRSVLNPKEDRGAIADVVRSVWRQLLSCETAKEA